MIARRTAAGMTQSALAKRVGVSVSYISALERDEPNAVDGSPRRPRVEKVEKIAKALNADMDEARLAAGFAPLHPRNGKPETLAELLDRLTELGVDNVHFADHDALRDATPEELQDVLDAVQLAIEVTLRRQNARTSSTFSIHRSKG